MHPSTALARVLVDELARQGVRDIVLAPGSRSAPLAFAVHAAAGLGQLRLHVRVDERSAAFLALGLAKSNEPADPVAVITTSGTAVANLHPAVLEASHTGLPLLVLTADRPPELRGIGANQTTEQVGIFGSAVRMMTDLAVPRDAPGQVRYWRDVVARAVAAARGTRSNDPGPVHLNIGLPEPLVPDDDEGWVEPLRLQPAIGGRSSSGTEPSQPPPTDHARVEELAGGLRTVVLAGDGAGWHARWLAETAGWPLLAEPSSGARSGPNAIGPYRLLLDAPNLGTDIERVIAYGRPTLSRPVTRLLARDDVELLVVSDRARWADPARRASAVLANPSPPHRPRGAPASGERPGVEHPARGAGSQPDEWLARWLEAGARADAAVKQVLADTGLSGPYVARAVAERVPVEGLLFAGSSNPIRDLDLAMRPYDHALDSSATDPRVLANRGVSGIDGTVSSAIGAALGWQARQRGEIGPDSGSDEGGAAGAARATGAAGGAGSRAAGAPARSGRAYALLGDLTFLHDSNGLVLGPDEARPDLVIVVLNDDGGGIFHTLEPGDSVHAASFERLFGTPHHVDLAALCAATGTAHERVETSQDLATALDRAERGAGIRVVEARVERSSRRDMATRIADAVAAAVQSS